MSLPASEAWNIDPECECCDRPYWWSFILGVRLPSPPGVDGRNCGGLVFIVCARCGIGGCCASDDVDRLNGLFSAGYAWCSKGGSGGASLNLLLLNAFRSDANDDFLAKGELLVVATDDWFECVKGGFTLRVVS